MNTNSANSIAGSASAAARALAASLPAAGHELADGALRAGGQLSEGLDEARGRLDDGRSRLTNALEAAVAATRSGLRNYRNQAVQQVEDATDRAAEAGGRAAEQLHSIGARMLKSAARHPYAAVGVVAAACYLIARRLMRRPADAKAAGAKRRARPRRSASSVRAKESRAGNGSASA